MLTYKTHELNLLSHVQTTLIQPCNFEFVASTLWQRCVLIVRRCGLTTTLPQRLVFAGKSRIIKIMHSIIDYAL